MKSILQTIFLANLLLLSACGISEEEKNKIINDAAKTRADQFCETADGSNNLDMYGQKLEYMLEYLHEEGITADADVNTATDLYDKKIKESCPDKFPK